MVELRRDKKGHFSSNRIHRFLGFLEGRAAVRVPEWWASTLTSCRVIAGSNVVYPESREYEYVRSAIGLDVGGNATLERSGTGVVIKQKQNRVEVPARLFDRLVQDAEAYGTDRISVLVRPDRCYVAIHPTEGGSFRLTAIDVKSREVIWNAAVWGVNRKKLGGQAYHNVAIEEQGRRVLVFGGESHGMFVEGFDAGNGKVLFRFCTCLWFGRVR
jgi:hypothetical protein